MQLNLGRRRDADADADASACAVELPAHALVRHIMALGASGSGKTVFCKIVVEEAVRCGIPVICIDPQGDLCSLALAPGDSGSGERDPRPEFLERAEVVLFTPASRRGVPLCADPLSGAIHDLPATDKVQALSRAADMIVSLLGYDGDSDDGAGLRAVIDTALADMDAAGRPARRLHDLTGFLTSLMDEDSATAGGVESAQLRKRYERFLDARKLRTACQRMARLDVGARRLLFHEGMPVDIDMLLGTNEPDEGRTRVSVIYLNTLHSQDDKDFFVATLVERLYEWMLRHPSTEPQALFYIDEIAPFMPPVRKPACKSGLQLLFKQARKYGIGCLMATQNPGDVDYKAMAQFGTWALGRLTTRQDLKKIAPVIKAMASGSVSADDILADLPARRPGEFTVLSPDHFGEPVPLATRWLHSAHETLDESRIERLTDDRWRTHFLALERARENPPKTAEDGDVGLVVTPVTTPTATPVTAPQPRTVTAPGATPIRTVRATPPNVPQATPIEAPRATQPNVPQATPIRTVRATQPNVPQATPIEAPRATQPNVPQATPIEAPRATQPNVPQATPIEAPRATQPNVPRATQPNVPRATPINAPRATPINVPRATPIPIPRSALEDRGEAADGRSGELERLARALAQLESANAREFAAVTGFGEKKARRLLKELVAGGHARSYRQGRSHRYFARARGARPDLGLGDTVAIISPTVDEARARELAQGLRRTGFLGLWGPDETLADVELIYRPVYQVVFAETVPRTGLSRLLGPSEDRLVGTVYHHPGNLQLVSFTSKRGIEFLDEAGDYASRIADFDGIARFDDVPPGTIAIDDAAWRARRTESDVTSYFDERFDAQPGQITPVFVPLWQIRLRQDESGNYRLLWIDGVVGKPVVWPDNQ